MSAPSVSVYGSMTCPDTVRARKYLDEHDVPYEFIDVDADGDRNDYIAGLNGGKRVMPTILLDDEPLFNPDLGDLAEAIREFGI